MVEIAQRRATLPADSAEFSNVLLSSGGAASRFVLRVSEAGRAAAEAAGLPLPARLNSAAAGNGCVAFKLGPDEFLLSAGEGHDAATRAFGERIAKAVGAEPHSLVDVSHRQTSVVIDGARAAEALSGFVPLDLDLAAFPVGMATRTIFEKCEIVLWRQAPDRFHIEVWRSFAPYVLALLDESRREHK